MILNGGMKWDEDGKWTYVGGKGESVIDYIIGNEDVWEKMQKMEVADRIDSDHFPAMVKLKGQREEGRRRKKGGDGQKRRRENSETN